MNDAASYRYEDARPGYGNGGLIYAQGAPYQQNDGVYAASVSHGGGYGGYAEETIDFPMHATDNGHDHEYTYEPTAMYTAGSAYEAEDYARGGEVRVPARPHPSLVLQRAVDWGSDGVPGPPQ